MRALNLIQMKKHVQSILWRSQMAPLQICSYGGGVYETCFGVMWVLPSYNCFFPGIWKHCNEGGLWMGIEVPKNGSWSISDLQAHGWYCWPQGRTPFRFTKNILNLIYGFCTNRFYSIFFRQIISKEIRILDTSKVFWWKKRKCVNFSKKMCMHFVIFYADFIWSA